MVRAESRHRYIVNGLKMYYEIHGSGEPVVLLRGVHVIQ